MDILVCGAGVTGSLYAAWLHRAGHNVTILARGQRLSDIRQHGIVLDDQYRGARTVDYVPVVERLSTDSKYDLVLVMVRKNQVSDLLPVLAGNQHTPNILFLMNNAAGPAEMIEALGYERVLLGFPGVGGVREGYTVRCVAGTQRRKPQTVFGEPCGLLTPRLDEIAAVLTEAGFRPVVSKNIDAWLKAHVAVVSPMANALYMCAGDNYRLARTRDGIVLMIRAMREGFRVLRARGVPIIPSYVGVLKWMPEPVLVALLSRLLNTRGAELAMAGHARAARDEMRCIADEFRALVHKTDVQTPAIDILYSYIDPGTAPVRPGSARIPLDWRPVWTALGVLGGAALGIGLLSRLVLRRKVDG